MSDKPGESRVPVDTWKEFDQTTVSHSAGHHLMAIGDLVGRLGYARVSDVARQLNITRGSVSISLQPLKKAGLIVQDENRHLRLSEQGQALVAALRTKRHLMQRLLAEVLGVAPEQAEIDACKLEHLLSNETAHRVLSFLRFLDTDAGRRRELVDAWRATEAGCERMPEQCPSCDVRCLAETIHDSPKQGRST
jgi:Mn-dependent DtxR family transcriptional regulator